MSMRGSWDARATMYFVDTRRRDWNAAEFYAAGREEALDLLPPAFERLGFDPAGKRILEIGCGLGRLFPGHVELFDEACDAGQTTDSDNLKRVVAGRQIQKQS